VIRADSFRILEGGRDRARRCMERGFEADDPSLPIRWLDMTRGDKTLSVAVGPIEPGGQEVELMEFELTMPV
jgi:hypothetical protein